MEERVGERRRVATGNSPLLNPLPTRSSRGEEAHREVLKEPHWSERFKQAPPPIRNARAGRPCHYARVAPVSFFSKQHPIPLPIIALPSPAFALTCIGEDKGMNIRGMERSAAKKNLRLETGATPVLHWPRRTGVRLKLSSLNEIERWVLSWGGDARVVQPRELAEAVKQAAEKILQVISAK